MIRNIEKIKAEYKAGTRIYITHISDNSYPNAINQRGTVDFVDDTGQIFCKMDNGTHATVCEEYGDIFWKVTG